MGIATPSSYRRFRNELKPTSVIAIAHESIEAILEGRDISADQRIAMCQAANLFADPMTRTFPEPYRFDWNMASFALSSAVASSGGYPTDGLPQEKYQYFRGFEEALKGASMNALPENDPVQFQKLQVAGTFLAQILEDQLLS